MKNRMTRKRIFDLNSDNEPKDFVDEEKSLELPAIEEPRIEEKSLDVIEEAIKINEPEKFEISDEQIISGNN